MFSALKEAQDVIATNDPANLQSTEMKAYLFSGLISVLEYLKKGWDSHLSSLKSTFSDIFKFV